MESNKHTSEGQEGEILNFGEAQVCIKIAQWRATEIMRMQNIEDQVFDAYISLRDMLSKIQLDNGLLFDPRKEKKIINLYKNPGRLRQIFHSQTIDSLLEQAFKEGEQYAKFRRKIFPYLPPYDKHTK